MKRLLLGVALLATTLLLTPSPASAAEYETFVGCDDLAANPIPAHDCQLGDFPGAYFETDEETEYEVCVEFPGGAFICAEEQPAEADILYVNSIFTDEQGEHFVSWFVAGVEVGSWIFRINAPPPPPVVAPVPLPSVVAAPPARPTPSVNCLIARRQVAKFSARLDKASGRKQRARLRAKLRKARTTMRRVCQP
jgi:hypothetical protein